MTDSAIRQPGGRAAITTARPEQPPDVIRSVLCIYCRTDKFVYWPPASRLPLADCPGCQRQITQPAGP
jgi:ribosomal protein S27E